MIRVLRTHRGSPEGGHGGRVLPCRDCGGRVDELLDTHDRGLAETGATAGEGINEVVELTLGKNAVYVAVFGGELGREVVSSQYGPECVPAHRTNNESGWSVILAQAGPEMRGFQASLFLVLSLFLQRCRLMFNPLPPAR